ncbi:MAG: hypothetical protein ISP86_00250 [Shewanellaceae bacterium]|nr:hypothetical protein [Shewanellaceae bacterium]
MVENIFQIGWHWSVQHPMVGLLVGVMLLMLLFVGLKKIQHSATRLFILSVSGIVLYSLIFAEGEPETVSAEDEPPAISASWRFLGWFDGWSDNKNDIHVIAKPLAVVLQDQDCRYETPFEVKSMQQSFFVPLEKKFDLLLFRLSDEKFMVKVRYKNERHILRTMRLRLKKGVFLEVDHKQYRLLYLMTDGQATVISVTRCRCEPKPSLRA